MWSLEGCSRGGAAEGNFRVMLEIAATAATRPMSRRIKTRADECLPPGTELPFPNRHGEK
jgi:hypothetical protein